MKDAITLLEEVQAWLNALPVPTSGALAQMRKIDAVIKQLAAQAAE